MAKLSSIEGDWIKKSRKNMNLFSQTREFVKKSYNGNEAQMKHFNRTVYWLQYLKPDADEALLIAAIGHDIERAFRSDALIFENHKGSFRDAKWLEFHSNEGAKILEAFLIKQKADSNLINRVKHLVSKHETGGDEDQNLLKDADSLSFLENNAAIFLSKIDKLGFDRVKEKFAWMYERISSSKAKEIAKPFYEKMMNDLEAHRV
jgi:hypothetical protein